MTAAAWRREAAWDAAFHERSPLFWPIARAARAFADHARFPPVADLARAFGGDPPVRFEVAPPRPRRRRRPVDVDVLYDGRIHLAGIVPSRERCWHDFLNALVWAAFPAAKRALHERQHRALRDRVAAGELRLPGARTRELDALALLDEGGVLVLCERSREPALRTALRDREDDALAAEIAGGRAVAPIFGHAMYEHLALGAPRVFARAHLFPVDGPLPADADDRARLADARLADALASDPAFPDADERLCVPVDLTLLGEPATSPRPPARHAAARRARPGSARP